MNERSSDSMLSFVADTLCCELKEKFIFAMPRVVPDQRATFESDELFRKLSRECEVRYTGFRDRPMDERQLRFQAECREGHADVAFVCTGTTLQLNFSANSWSERPEDRVLTREYVDFDSEPGKVHLKSQFILNGVCVLWRGYIDLVRLDGIACLEFDRERAEVEDSLLREQMEQNSRRVQEFEDRSRQQHQLDHERHDRQERHTSSEAEVVEALLRFSEAPQGGNSSSSSSSISQPQHLQQFNRHHEADYSDTHHLS
ncbi:core-binding factor subunit beta [Plakobranchus ocellatus]|uniref:Core-binding factor subunit beta n=1 Tax=Plakobranchus ocellatus TaxID=259542 RepID=A0AAV3ZAE2_9GAST|nr:core-binding factor subunit beta [Plakobranchus ocellatus]